MLELPWTCGPAAGSLPAGADVVVMATRLELRSRRSAPGFLLASLRLRRLFRRTPGGVGMALAADLRRRTFWTLSSWSDEPAMAAFVRTELHARVAHRYRPAMADSAFRSWSRPASAAPVAWEEARSRTASVAPVDDGPVTVRTARR